MNRLQLGVPGQIMPPADRAVRFAQRSEADGYDAVWWPDHLMGWHADTMWTPDLTPLADVQANPHTYFDPMIMLGVVGAQTSRIKVGVVVTDLIRRNPAMAASTALTLDHVTQGRAIIGLGSGEKLNVTPYGMSFDKPVAKLSEGIDVMRLLRKISESGTAVLMATHNYTLMQKYPSRVIKCDNGTISCSVMD